jgi:drug/metabolite transporter (DMT)-like permease
MFYLRLQSGWEIGVCLSVIGSGLTSCGLVLQKYSHSENARKGQHVLFFRQPLWLAGLAVFICGQVGNVVAMAFAPQTMLSCLGALSLVWNALFAFFLLRERVLLAELLSMLGMIGGVLMVISSTPVVEEPEHLHRNKTVADVVSTLMDAEFFGVAFAFALVLTVGIFLVQRAMPGMESIYWAFATAVAGGYTVTLFKCTANVFARVRFPWNDAKFYVVVGTAVVLCLTQVHTLNLALKKGNAVTVVPVYFSMGVLMQLLQAEVAYKELDTLSGRKNVAIFISGVGLVLVGIIAMVRAKIAAEEEDEGREEPCDEVERQLSPAQAMAPKSESTPLLEAQLGTRTLGKRQRLRSMPHIDPSMFQESFGGSERRYTISLTGPVGIG